MLQKATVVHLLMGTVVLASLMGWAHRRVQGALVLSPHRVARGQVHRLLTAGWVHGDLSHLGFNMLSLWIFADRVVSVLGDAKFMLLYVSAVVVAFLPTTLRYRRHVNYTSLGASGAVAAVMVSAVLLHPKMQLHLFFLPWRIPGVVFAVAYLAYSIWHSRGSDDNINHDAHFSGAAYGALLTYVLEPAKVQKSIRVFVAFVS